LYPLIVLIGCVALVVIFVRRNVEGYDEDTHYANLISRILSIRDELRGIRNSSCKTALAPLLEFIPFVMPDNPCDVAKKEEWASFFVHTYETTFVTVTEESTPNDPCGAMQNVALLDETIAMIRNYIQMMTNHTIIASYANSFGNLDQRHAEVYASLKKHVRTKISYT
jgi:hypothetical protein